MRTWIDSTAAKAWLAALGLSLLGLAPGCGSKDDPASAPTSDAPLASVAGADEATYVAWLKANDLTREPVTAEGGTRSGGGSESSLWPLHPRGEVRLEGLQTWRVEVDPEGFSPGGHLEFRKGKEVLWRDDAEFTPAGEMAKGGLPSPVIAALKAGDTITWGIVYGDKRDVTTTFKIVTKAAIEKQVERIQRDRRNQKQSPLIKQLGKNQVLVNNSLYSEALADYIDITEKRPAVSEAWTRIVECMRQLGLKGTRLYQDALEQLKTSAPRARPVPAEGGLGGGVDGGEIGLGDEAPKPRPMTPTAEGRAQALANAKAVAKSRAERAMAEAAKQAEAAQQAEAKAEEAKNAMGNAPQGAVEQAQAYERARLAAESAKQAAQAAGKRQLDQERLAQFLEKMGAPMPTDVPDPQVAKDVLTNWVSGLKQAADAKQAEAAALAADAARAEAHKNDPAVPDANRAEKLFDLKEQARLAQEEADALRKDAEQAARAVKELLP